MNSVYLLVLALFLFASGRKLCQASSVPTARMMQEYLDSFDADKITTPYESEVKWLKEQQSNLKSLRIRQANEEMKLKTKFTRSFSRDEAILLAPTIFGEFNVLQEASDKIRTNEILIAVARMRSFVPDYRIDSEIINQKKANNIPTSRDIIIEAINTNSLLLSPDALKRVADFDFVQPNSFDIFVAELEGEIAQAWSQAIESINKMKIAYVSTTPLLTEKFSSESLVNLLTNLKSLQFKYSEFLRMLREYDTSTRSEKIITICFAYVYKGYVNEYIHKVVDILEKL